MFLFKLNALESFLKNALFNFLFLKHLLVYGLFGNCKLQNVSCYRNKNLQVGLKLNARNDHHNNNQQ